MKVNSEMTFKLDHPKQLHKSETIAVVAIKLYRQYESDCIAGNKKTISHQTFLQYQPNHKFPQYGIATLCHYTSTIPC